jgi:putative hemolysin
MNNGGREMDLQRRSKAGVGLLIVLSFVAACQAKETDTPAGPAGLPNPASVYCTGLGYREETRTNDAGEYGICIFPDGTECDSWDFLAGRCGQEHSYCAQQGGTLEEGEGNIGVCRFDDGSSFDEYSFFRGE